jgi:peptide/nickel transport system permease protein
MDAPSLGEAPLSLSERDALTRSGPWSGAYAFVRRLLRVRLAGFALALIVVTLVLAIFAPLLSPYDPSFTGPDPLAGPSARHLLGTDQLGRDELSQLIYGARITLWVSTIAVIAGGLVGGLLGVTSGYVRGFFDTVAMRCMDALVAFPGLILALALASALGPNARDLVIAIGIANVPWIARIARSQALQVRELPFIEAARSLGASPARIVLRHVLPNALAPIVVQATLGMGYAVLAIAALSFLGAGVPPPATSWGTMLQFAFGLVNQAPMLSLIPGVAIFLLVLAFNILGDGLREALDPRLSNTR